MRAIWILFVLGFVAVVVSGEDAGDYEYEDEPVAPVKKPVAPSPRGRSLPSIPARNNKIVPPPSKPGKAAKPVEPEPSQAPEEDVEGDEDGLAEEAPEETSTEPPKRTIKPVVRPFRSNDDLLAALKRRRQQAQAHGTVVDKTTTHAPPSTESPKGKSSQNLSKNNKRARVGPTPQTPTEAPARRSPPPPRRPSSRTALKPIQPDEEPSEQQEVTVKPKFSRGSRRL